MSTFASVMHVPNGFALPLSAKREQGKTREYGATVAEMSTLLECAYKDINVVFTGSTNVYVNAKRHLQENHPTVIFFPCFVDQANLIIKQHVTRCSAAKDIVDICQKICSFFSHSPWREIFLKYSRSQSPPKMMTKPQWNSAVTMLDSVIKPAGLIAPIISVIESGMINAFNPEIKSYAVYTESIGPVSRCSIV